MSEVKTVYYNQSESESTAIKSKWWEQPENEMHKHVFGVVTNIKEQQKYRSVNNLRYARLYSNMELVGLQAGAYARSADAQTFLQNRVTYNVIKSCIDTAAAKIAKNKPRPFFLTDGGGWTMQRKGMRLTKYMEGLFDSIGTSDGDNRTMWGLGRRAFVDAGILGTGAVKFFIENNNVKAERVLIEEIVVDDTEGRYEQPRQLFQEKLVHREVLLDTMPKKYHDKIRAATSGLTGEQYAMSSADMITVVEGWHLPSGEDSKDGKKVMCIENCTLDVAEWDKNYFPFAFQRWSPRLLGFYGCGLAEELLGIQLEINKLLRTIQISQHLMAVPQIWLEYASKTVTKHVNNEIGGIKYYAGRPPVHVVPQAMSSEVYQHLENLYRKAYEITGISQLSASAKKPSGLDAAVALREYQDIESERFQLVGQRHEEFYMDATKICLDLLDDIAEAGGNPAVRIKESEKSFTYKWKDVRLPKDQYTLRAFPTSLLPSTPAGKLQKVQEMLQAGLWEKEEALELLEFPDIKSVINIKTSMRRNLKRIIEKIIDDNEYIAPEPYIDLQYAKQIAQAYFNAGQADGMPEDRLEKLQRFMEDVQSMLERQAEAVAPPVDPMAAMGGMAPMGQPEAPPTSDLLPIAGGQ
jgi:hypothetical protein